MAQVENLNIANQRIKVDENNNEVAVSYGSVATFNHGYLCLKLAPEGCLKSKTVGTVGSQSFFSPLLTGVRPRSISKNPNPACSPCNGNTGLLGSLKKFRMQPWRGKIMAEIF